MAFSAAIVTATLPVAPLYLDSHRSSNNSSLLSKLEVQEAFLAMPEAAPSSERNRRQALLAGCSVLNLHSNRVRPRRFSAITKVAAFLDRQTVLLVCQTSKSN